MDVQICKRISLLFVGLLGSAVIAFTAFSRGFSWIFDSQRNYSPFLSCFDGAFCRLTIPFALSVEEIHPQWGQCVKKNIDAIVCNANCSCHAFPPLFLPEPFCDSWFRVTPSNAVAMRGVMIACIMIVVIWSVAEYVLRAVEAKIRIEVEKGRAGQKINLVPENIASIKQAWSSCSSSSSFDSSAGFSSPLRHLYTDQDKSDGQWKRELSRYHRLKGTEYKRIKSFSRSFLLSIFYCALIMFTIYVILHLSPTSSGNDSFFLADSSVWRIYSGLDAIIFIDILLDVVMFVIAALAVEWPKPPLFAQHLEHRLAEQNQNNEPQNLKINTKIISNFSMDTESLSFVLKQSMSADCCLMIACHESTLTDEKSFIFANTLRAALKVFPPNHIFVCDNGSSYSPADDTQLVARSVHVDINYVYIPEGNKTFAFYWTNHYWIPFLNKCGLVPPFTYALIIDDDVPLPPDLHIPHEHLKQRPEIKAVHFPITATSPTGNAGFLIKCQDIEYKLAAVHKQFQARLSRCLSCHGAIALWDRKAMDEVFFTHDTVFHGEDMYMGLCLLRKRDDSIIISAAQSIVPTYAPGELGMLFRQRVKSWELTSHRKTLTYIKEVLAPRSFCHMPSLVLKPYFLQEVITILLDWLRVFLLCGLFLRDWRGLLLMTAFFMSLMYLQVLLFSFFVLRSRRNLAPSVSTIIVFPFYRLCGLLFRICALCHNLLVYSHNRTAIKIGIREDEIKDIPPTPPAPTVDWFTLWKIPENRKTTDSV